MKSTTAKKKEKESTMTENVINYHSIITKPKIKMLYDESTIIQFYGQWSTRRIHTTKYVDSILLFSTDYKNRGWTYFLETS